MMSPTTLSREDKIQMTSIGGHGYSLKGSNTIELESLQHIARANLLVRAQSSSNIGSTITGSIAMSIPVKPSWMTCSSKLKAGSMTVTIWSSLWMPKQQRLNRSSCRFFRSLDMKEAILTCHHSKSPSATRIEIIIGNPSMKLKAVSAGYLPFGEGCLLDHRAI
jgi:hypothetical protein